MRPIAGAAFASSVPILPGSQRFYGTPAGPSQQKPSFVQVAVPFWHQGAVLVIAQNTNPALVLHGSFAVFDGTELCHHKGDICEFDAL